METIDEVKKGSDVGTHFALFGFYIHIKFKIVDLKNGDLDSFEDFSKLLHEYTHYLQGFCTLSGATTLFKYFSLQHKIVLGVMENLLHSKDYDANFYGQFENEYNNICTLYQYDLSKHDTEVEKFKIHAAYIPHPVLKGTNKEYFIRLEDDLLQHVSPKCLRETMATMTYCTLKGYSKLDAKAYLEQESIDPIYKYVYLYFFHKYPKINDLVKFVYFFSELCLQAERPSVNFRTIVDELDGSVGSYVNADAFFGAFIRKHPELKMNLSKTIIYFEKEITKIERLSSSMQYYEAIRFYLRACVEGLKYIYTNNSLYRGRMDATYLRSFISRFSSPVVVESEPPTTIKSLDSAADIQNLSLLFGVSLLLEQYIVRKTTFERCPFLEEVPICPLHKERDIEICARRPYHVKPFDNGGCIFYNANLVVGMLPDDEIAQYVDKKGI